MKKSNKAISGVIVPIITPVDKNEKINEKPFKSILNHCLNANVDGIFVGGSAGMGPLLTESQWIKAIEIARDNVSDSKFLLGGIICTSTAIAIERIKILEKVGYKYMVVTPTYYINLNAHPQFFTHFDMCRQSTDMEMIAYNIPSCTYSQIPIDTLRLMAEKGFYKAIKESSGNREYFRQVLKIAKKFKINALQGNEPDIEWGLSNGAAGIVPVCANFEPKTYVAAWNSRLKNDKKTLTAAQDRANFLRDNLLVKSEHWIAGIMYGAKTLGFGNGKPVKPLLEISKESKKRIDSLKVIN
ncbi:MAG: hypothetical protein A2Y10_12950 [Planctomycetes bacterium GWF2_41_51]|nr:MAG: hypothetical protein A2Y10_12950 [Planctomycetes bacterium GWF2_41_51]HBG28219.1 hypothetical protein [Phycisphaerales bacterium]